MGAVGHTYDYDIYFDNHKVTSDVFQFPRPKDVAMRIKTHLLETFIVSFLARTYTAHILVCGWGEGSREGH